MHARSLEEAHKNTHEITYACTRQGSMKGIEKAIKFNDSRTNIGFFC
jgi:hypothetical protein